VVQGTGDRLDGWMDTSTALPDLDETLLATTRYLQALTVLDDEAAGAPSVLPGWSRAHVVAHLSRNADAFAGVLRQAAAGEPAAMYRSADARNADIEETVRTKPAAALVEDARVSAEGLEREWRACRAPADTLCTRVPGGSEPFALRTVGWRRWVEVEVHHADLDLGYSPADWTVDFSLRLVGQRQDEMAALPDGGPSMVLSSTDVEGLWTLGPGQGPEIRGTVGDLAWWLVGRGGGRGVTSSTGELPALGRWR
jgi:maleylpyruvate isomerase